MPVAMVQVGQMGVSVGELRMPVWVGMGLWAIACRMFMLVVCVMNMQVGMLHGFVQVVVGVLFGQRQPGGYEHQPTSH